MEQVEYNNNLLAWFSTVGNWKIWKKLQSFCWQICGFLKIFFVKILLTRQNIRCYVTMGNMLPRQNRTRQNLAEPYTPHFTHSTLFIVHFTL